MACPLWVPSRSGGSNKIRGSPFSDLQVVLTWLISETQRLNSIQEAQVDGSPINMNQQGTHEFGSPLAQRGWQSANFKRGLLQSKGSPYDGENLKVELQTKGLLVLGRLPVIAEIDWIHGK